MNRKNNYMFRSQRKQKSKVLPISLLISGIIITGIVVWIGVNNWDVEKSYLKVKTAIGITNEKSQKPADLNAEQDIASQNEEKPGPTETDDSEEEKPEQTTPPKDNRNYIEGQKLPSTPTYINGVLIANKQYPLPKDYAPGVSEEAKNAFDKMASEASLEGYQLTAFSTYRSFEYQTGLYERYVEKDGAEAADRYSARPGYSEHQTGLAFDIGEVNGESDWLTSGFGETEAGKWIASNAHRFGFIMRYPDGKEKITGYMYEPWHFRYIGIELAEEIFTQKITLEEYLGLY